MRAQEFTSEGAFGTSPKRTARNGSRPSRGHEPVSGYTTKDVEEHKKGIRAMKYSTKPKKPVNPSDVHAKAKAKINPAPRPAPKVDAHLGEEHFCEVCGGSLAEAGKASRALCISSKPDGELGASALASCKSQGLRARDGKKSHLMGKGPESRMVMGGHKVKGKKYGGKIPDWGTRKG